MQTVRQSKFYNKNNSNKNSSLSNKVKKPYSEYFKSRIFEIPIEMNLKKDIINE